MLRMKHAKGIKKSYNGKISQATGRSRLINSMNQGHKKKV